MTMQRLWGKKLGGTEDVLRYLGAMQAQEYAYAKWSIAQRAARTTNTDVDEALARGAILRTHILRPTWHFVLPEDIRWMLVVSAPRVRKLVAYYDRQHGIDTRAG
jgi:hypothetical protein